MYMVRTMDEYGRLVIPPDVRYCTGIEKHGKIRITMENGKMVVEKYEEQEEGDD